VVLNVLQVPLLEAALHWRFLENQVNKLSLDHDLSDVKRRVLETINESIIANPFPGAAPLPPFRYLSPMSSPATTVSCRGVQEQSPRAGVELPE
jgi:hypothetical protein